MQSTDFNIFAKIITFGMNWPFCEAAVPVGWAPSHLRGGGLQFRTGFG